jgi:serine/threonine protein kinase
MSQMTNGRWKVVRSLGEGGQGRTFLVRDVNADSETLYVLKRLKNPARVRRLRTEVEAISKLSHAAIVKLVDADIDTEQPYLVMEYCQGGALSLARPFWRDSTEAALLLFEQILEGVSHAHANGVIHRDIKPENIFLRTSDGLPVLGDFGLSYLEDDPSQRQTAMTEAVGPRLFMAPELEDGRLDKVTALTDVYSLGKLLYWLLAGRVYSREKHRLPAWDVKSVQTDPMTGEGNSFLEHVNDLLDKMVVEDPLQRRDVANVLILVRQARHLIVNRAHPLTMSVRHPCSFCGRGAYVLTVDGDVTAVSNFGLRAVAGNHWRALVCDRCGHVQLFNHFDSTPWK